MPRSLVLGNGSLLASFDEHLQMRDFYYPYVGSEDHTTYGNVHKVGFLVEGKGFSWLDDGSWTIVPAYAPSTLVGASTLRNERLGLSLVAEDFVDPLKAILIRSFRMRTVDGKERRVQCFFHHDLHLYGGKQKDTAFYEPHTKSVIHYRQKRYFLIGGTTSDPVTCVPSQPLDEFHPLYTRNDHIDHCGIISFAIGKSKYRGLEGTWRDAEDGVLSRAPIEQGSVDSTVEIDCLAHPDRDTLLHVWICAGKDIKEVHDLQHYVLDETPEELKLSTQRYWKGWVEAHDAIQKSGEEGMPEDLLNLYHRSLLVIRTQTDNHGGIIAANDSDIMEFNRDTYTYVWPRDGALVCMALTRAGQSEVVTKFFEFCARVQTQEGYLLHKYNPDGSAGSSWHPWYNGGELQLPIQCDETALPISAMWRHFERFADFEFLNEMYERYVKRAANFLSTYVDGATGLPLPSYDLWEEQRGVFTFTTAATVAGLRDASRISQALGHKRHAKKYADAAEKMKEAMLTHLYDEETGCFLKKLDLYKGDIVGRTAVPDVSAVAVWLFGILPADDPRVASTMQVLKDTLTVRTPVGGMARYVNDRYQFLGENTPDVPGNPWVLTTLWYAQWLITIAKEEKDLEEPLSIMRWAQGHATPSGLLPEQMHPHSGKQLSVSPLTWSHAEFVNTFVMYGEKKAEFRM